MSPSSLLLLSLSLLLLLPARTSRLSQAAPFFRSSTLAKRPPTRVRDLSRPMMIPSPWSLTPHLRLFLVWLPRSPRRPLFPAARTFPLLSPQLAKQQIPREDTSDAQGPKQTHDAFDDMVPVLEAGEVGQRVGAMGALASGGRPGRTINDLDMHCLTKIFSRLGNTFLRACSLVCCEWLDASNYARAGLTLQGQPRIATLPRILSRFSDLRFVQLMDIGKGSELQRHVPACLSDALLILLAQSCPHLFRLTLVRCGVVSDAGLASVLRDCPGLRSLRMDQCEGFGGAAFEGVRCLLEEVNMFSCSGLTDAGVGAVASACPELQELTVRMEEREAAQFAAGFEKVALLCPSLSKITVIACGITNTTLHRFAGNCPLLADVRIASEPAISDGGIVILRCGLPRLDHLTLVNNRRLWKVPGSGRFLRLKELGVGCFVRATDQMLQRISEEESLEELRIVSCPALTDATVRKIMFGCRRINRLLITDCELVTSGILKAYAESGSKAQVEIRGCKGVKEEMLPEEVRLLGKIVIG